jgi:hypothetical protein
MPTGAHARTLFVPIARSTARYDRRAASSTSPDLTSGSPGGGFPGSMSKYFFSEIKAEHSSAGIKP